MPSRSTRVGLSRVWAYYLMVLALGVMTAVIAIVSTVQDGVGEGFVAALVVAVPLIAVIARFPMVLEGRAGGIEVGFESCVLMFLLRTIDAGPALVVWAAGVLLTQALSGKTAGHRTFNIGAGIAGGGLAALVYAAANGSPSVESPRGLLAVALAATSYFVTDYVLTATALVLASRSSSRSGSDPSGTLLAFACFVPLNSLGYLAAVVERSAPAWVLVLLVVPLATVLIATRAVTRGRENARRLTVLFRAAGRAQTLADQEAVLEALCEDARELLRFEDVRIGPEPPAADEIGVELDLGGPSRWLVARAAHRARATVSGDLEGLRALAAVASDANARIDLVDDMVHLARHDPLTDLPNRAILLDRTVQALDLARATGTQTALMFLDLDGFKPVNDRFGHQAGDVVLIEIAARLRECVRKGDTVARLGGDEFAVLVEDCAADDVAKMCDRMLVAIQRGAIVSGQQVRLSASVGVAFDCGDDTAGSLLRHADMAMYEAKAAGKGRCVVFEPETGQARVDRLEMLEDLRAAIEANQLEVAYQPVIEAETGRIVGVETLARWQRNGVPVPPDVFIALAEESGLIVGLGEAVLRRVGRDTAAIMEAGGSGLSMSVNISAGQLRDPGFAATVARAVRATAGMHLVLEITERQGVDLTGEVLAMMRTISDMGVHFAIDDFGVGFSSISYLHDLPATVLKADASLSQDIDRDERARSLLRSVAEMGRVLGFRIVVEGIERDAQLEVIREDAAYALVQGYLLHRPMPLAKLLELVADEHAVPRPRMV